MVKPPISQEQVVSERGLRRLHRGGGGDLGCTKVEGMVPATRLMDPWDPWDPWVFNGVFFDGNLPSGELT